MSSPETVVSWLRELVERFQGWRRDPRYREDAVETARVFDLFAAEFARHAGACAEIGGWSRLAAGLLRGEDVPDSIHPAEGEDPADTARWEKWRVS